jgi:hypothetical protein
MASGAGHTAQRRKRSLLKKGPGQFYLLRAASILRLRSPWAATDKSFLFLFFKKRNTSIYGCAVAAGILARSAAGRFGEGARAPRRWVP